MKGAWLRLLLLLLLVLALAIGGGWWMMHGQVTAPPSPPAPPVAVPAENSPPLKATHDGSLTLPNVIEPYESVPVSTNLTASIASLVVRDGETVRKGQLLCALDATELQRDINAEQVMVLQAEELLHDGTQERSLDRERKRLVLATTQKDLESFQASSALQLEEAKNPRERADVAGPDHRDSGLREEGRTGREPVPGDRAHYLAAAGSAYGHDRRCDSPPGVEE